MKYLKNEGCKLAAQLKSFGAEIIAEGGAIFQAAYHRLDAPLDGYELREAERAACAVLEAIVKYEDAVKRQAAPPADPVITWPRPSYHRQAGNPRQDVLPVWCSLCHRYSRQPGSAFCSECNHRNTPVIGKVPCMRDDGPDGEAA